MTWDDVMIFNIQRENQIIFDLGGHRGDWTQIVLDKYPNATIYVFEPIKEYYHIICERFKEEKNVKIFNFAISNKTYVTEISLEGDKSSMHGDLKTVQKESINVKNITEFLYENKIFFVDLIKINIEGEEYNLLENLINTPELCIFQNYAVQFHTNVENHKLRRNKILDSVKKFYNIIFNVDFVWESWSIKKIKKINAVGDSHISCFSFYETLQHYEHSFENFKSYRHAGMLAYNLILKPELHETIKKLNKNESFLISFGEVDCRAQVKNRSDQYCKSEFDIIDDILYRYFKYIDSLDFKQKIVFSIIPEMVEFPNRYYYENHLQDFDCPRGTFIERTSYKDYFDNKLKQICLEKNYIYVSIYNYIKNNPSVYKLDDIHVHPQKVMYLIKYEFIKNNLIENENYLS